MIKRIMVTRYGYIEVTGNLTDEEAIESIKDCSESDFSWEPLTAEDAEVVDSYNIDDESPIKKDEVCIFTLRRIRPDGLNTEVYEDDFLIRIADGVSPSAKYGEEILRNAAKDIILSKHSSYAMYESCADFNWGDFVVVLPDDIMKKYGIYYADKKSIAKTGAILIPEHYTINVNQDEVLIPWDADECEIIVRRVLDGTCIDRIEATADFGSGKVVPADGYHDIVVTYINLSSKPAAFIDDVEFFISFHEGSDNEEIRVAPCEEKRNGSNDLYYFIQL